MPTDHCLHIIKPDHGKLRAGMTIYLNSMSRATTTRLLHHQDMTLDMRKWGGCIITQVVISSRFVSRTGITYLHRDIHLTNPDMGALLAFLILRQHRAWFRRSRLSRTAW